MRQKYYQFFKRLLDVIFACVGTIICIPFFLIIAILIKFDSKGPVFFHHKRIGYHGEEITILKFRTMVDNAEDLIKNFTPEQKEEWKANFKLAKDPRVTKVGNVLRKTSLDELPQIIDVLLGKLSFVGPRPLTDEEFKEHNVPLVKYTSVRPGLTGNWACNGRSNVDYSSRIDMELYYVDNCSLFLDIKILFKTVFVVLSREGAR